MHTTAESSATPSEFSTTDSRASKSKPGVNSLPLQDFLADAIRRAEFAVELCTRIEPARLAPEDIRELDAALSAWLARRNLARGHAA
jgi:hypothetical protein